MDNELELTHVREQLRRLGYSVSDELLRSYLTEEAQLEQKSPGLNLENRELDERMLRLRLAGGNSDDRPANSRYDNKYDGMTASGKWFFFPFS